MPIRIEFYDTTLRDGAQSEGVAFSLNDKLIATRKLDELGIDYIEGGYPASNEKYKSYFESVASKPPNPTPVSRSFSRLPRRSLRSSARRRNIKRNRRFALIRPRISR